MTVDKVTISSRFGDDLTVEEYEEAERGDLIEQEIKRLYPQISGEFAKTLFRGYKNKWADPKTKRVSGRYLSLNEIRKENEEMAKQTQAIRRTVLLNMMKNAGSWVSPKELAKGTGLDLSTVSHRGSLSSAVSTLYPFLEQCGVVERRQDPASRGYVYCYSEIAADKPEQIIDQVFTDFQNYERKRMADKRAEARGESPSSAQEPKASPQDNGTQIPRPLESMLPLVTNGDGLHVKVDINFNVRFGLLKE